MLAGGGIDYSNPQWCVSKSLNGLPDNWASDIITFGLTIIFMRGGLEMDLELVKKAGAASLRLTVMPGVTEAIMVGVFSMLILGMSFILGLSLGFILAAVSPAVVVGAMFELKKKGYGVKQNIPVLVVAAASMDDVVAISGFAICISFAIPPKDPTTTTLIINLIHGPVLIGLGATLGLIGGNIAAMTKVWDTHWKRVAIVAIQGFFLAFMSKKLEREWTIDGAHPIGASTGILGALAMAFFTSYMWERGKGYYTTGKEKHHAHAVEATLASLWSIIAQPLLFGVVGSYLDFRRMPGETIGKAILTVAIGVTFRTAMAFCAMFKAGLTTKEQLFVALSWLPKATVQAAFCSYPYDKIYSKGSDEWDSAEQEADYKKWGMDIMVTGGLAILMTAPIGLIIIQKLGPKWLEQDKSQGMEKSIDDMVEKELEERTKKKSAKMPS
jgi:NhaP-type Na+/H+ or K+/H+ antiporter